MCGRGGQALNLLHKKELNTLSSLVEAGSLNFPVLSAGDLTFLDTHIRFDHSCSHLRFEVLTAVLPKMQVMWGDMLCHLVNGCCSSWTA